MSPEDQVLREAREALKRGDAVNAFELVRRTLRPDHPFVIQARAGKLLASIPAGTLAKLTPLKIALVSSSTVDHFADILRYWLATAGFLAEIYVAPFDMMVQTVLDTDGELYAFQPDVVWLFTSHRDVRIAVSPGVGHETVQTAVGEAIGFWRELWQGIQSRLSCIVIQNNADIPAEDPFGNMSGAAVWGARSRLRLYNYELAAAASPEALIFDLDHVAGCQRTARGAGGPCNRRCQGPVQEVPGAGPGQYSVGWRDRR
jgi:predicted enzyme involved in methoxymalonyl-ACP biosynthesis